MSAQEPPVPPAVANEFRLSSERLMMAPGEAHDQISMTSSQDLKHGVGFKKGLGLEKVARRSLGLIMLTITVFLWTSSNFLASVSDNC
jgi:solute carrier family 35 protein F5